jgi:DNA primase
MWETAILTEDSFDVAALVEAEFYNAVASFGAHLSAE